MEFAFDRSLSPSKTDRSVARSGGGDPEDREFQSRIRGAFHARKRDFRFEKRPQTGTTTFYRSTIGPRPARSIQEGALRWIDRKPRAHTGRGQAN